MNAASVMLLSLSLLGLACAQEPGVIKGKVIIPPTLNHASTVVYLHTPLGEELRTFVNSDGTFAFQGVPAGIHLLQPFHLSLVYPEVRLDVNRKGSVSRASFSHNRNMVLQSPLVLRPVAEAQYYEKRKPFDVWSFIKSPYGLMIVFSVFAIVVFPRLKMDPEDYKEMQEQIKPAGAAGSPAIGAGGAGQARIRQ